MRLLRALALVVVLLPAGSCVLSGGVDCGDACDKAAECEGLERTWLLDCSPIGGNCVDRVAVCADCVLQRSCDEMKAGACDAACTP